MPDLPSHFGPYQIIGPLDAGGMGQVYRARDTRLQRSVAVKVLHDGASRDPERQRRFAQEAIAASALNHPNILTVYDVGIAGDAQFLVSELIDGESLRTEMNRERMPLRRVIEVAQQIADGLAAAHDAGIVHRDLKPENVVVTAEGRVKIVDFGLAKSVDGEAAVLGEFTATKTAEGLIMGTVPYMSPEQARGGAADFRSDQFALGVILYELTTLTHPFKRETAVQTLSAIIADDPPDPAQIAPTLPVAVRWLIRRLLSKNPRQRFASTSDLAADLRTIRDYLSEATSSGATAIVEPPRSRWPIAIAIAAIAVAGVISVVWALTPPDVPHFDKYTPFATEAGYQSAPVWSPDGKQIAYEADVNGIVQVFTRSLDSPGRTQVTNRPTDCYVAAWSVDGYIYFHSQFHEVSGLYKVSPVGGNPEPVLDNATSSAISPDGKTIFFLRDKDEIHYDLWSASLPDADGTKQPYLRGAFKDLNTTSTTHLKFSRDGSKLLLWVGPGPGPEGDSGIWEILVPGGEPRPLLGSFTNRTMTPLSFSWVDNRNVVVTGADGSTPGEHLWLADTETDRVVRITTTPGNERSPSISPDGRTIAMTVDATDFDLVEVPIDGSRPRPVINTTRNEFDPAVSPGGAYYAFVTDRTGEPQIWLQNQDDSKPLVTTADFGGVVSLAIGALAFSPDGTRLAFQAAGSAESSTLPNFGGGSRVWVKTLAGGKPFPIGGNETYQDAPTWSPHGDWIAYLSSQNRGPIRLVKSQVGARGTPISLANEPIPPFVVRPQWSPDGTWILCETSEGLSLIAADGSLRTQVISDKGWLTYAWDTDGRRILGLLPSEDFRNIMLVALDVQTRALHVINPDLGSIPQALQPVRGFSRFRSGFLTSIAHVRSDIYLVEGFELPRRWWERVWRLGRSDRP